MKRFLSIAALCLLAAACSNSSDDGEEPTPVAPADNGMDPTTMLLESPPTDGKLPNDLMPPT
jgi:hypothetical protein